MNTTQRQSILDAIVEFGEADFYSPFKDKYGAEETVDTVIFSDYTVAELIALAKRAVSQLECILNTNVWQVLPSDNIQVSIYGVINLSSNISNITNRLLNANYKDAALSIKAQINFQMLYGFWEKPKHFELKIRESSLSRLEHRVELSNSLVDEKVIKANSLITELEERKKEIEDLISIKKQEFETLRQNQSDSNVILANIQSTQDKAVSSQATIETLNGQANNIVTAIKSTQEKIDEQIKNNSNIISQSQKALEDFNIDAENKIARITSDYDSVSNNAEEVRKMMGYIADGTLSHSFNSRKKELSKRTNWWIVGCIIIALFAIGWVCVVFFWLNANTGYEWADIIINGVKSSPAFILLGFAISQYQKERNLTEEYAFRESVAITLTAYLEQMPNREEEDKRKLLISTVEQLYAKPVIASKEYDLLKFDSKDIAETSRTLKELVETLLHKK